MTTATLRAGLCALTLALGTIAAPPADAQTPADGDTARPVEGDATLDALNAAIAIDPGDAAARLARAEIWHHQSAWGQALADLDAVLDTAPDTLPALVLRARVNARAGRVAAALDDYARALGLAPDDAGLAAELAAERTILETKRDSARAAAIRFAPEAVMDAEFLVVEGSAEAPATLHIVHSATALAAETGAVDRTRLAAAVASGALQVIHIFTYTGEDSAIWGNLGLICAGADGFWPVYDRLATTAGQAALAAVDRGERAALDALLSQGYAAAGIGTDRLDACARDRGLAVRYLADWQKRARAGAWQGVNLLDQAPVWVLNGRSLSAADLAGRLAEIGPGPTPADTASAMAEGAEKEGAEKDGVVAAEPADGPTDGPPSGPPGGASAPLTAALPVSAAAADPDGGPPPDEAAGVDPDHTPAPTPNTAAETDTTAAELAAAADPPRSGDPAASPVARPAPPRPAPNPRRATAPETGPETAVAATVSVTPASTPKPNAPFPPRPQPVGDSRIPSAFRGVYAPSLVECLAYLDGIDDPTRLGAVLPALNRADGPTPGTILITSRRVYLFDQADTECAIVSAAGDGADWRADFACTTPRAPERERSLQLAPAAADGTAPRVSAGLDGTGPATLRQCRALGQLGAAFAALWTPAEDACATSVTTDGAGYRFALDAAGDLVLRLVPADAPAANPSGTGPAPVFAAVDGVALDTPAGPWAADGWRLSLGPFEVAAERLAWGMFLDLRSADGFQARLPLFGSGAAMAALADCAATVP